MAQAAGMSNVIQERLAGELSRLAERPEWLLAALDPERVRAALERHIPEFASGALRLRSIGTARLFMKDIQASRDMYYDEELDRDLAKRNAMLDTPVTDFELSVRARNCLKKMNIRTLGDLLRVSEAELLAYKNFGETSLVEIKHMLSSKGLRLGQSLEEGAQHEMRYRPPAAVSEEQQAVLNKPVSDLNLSVRARKCMNRLGINTLGELIQRTADELLESRNFGMTSLNEVREKLGQYGLTLRGD